MSAGAPDSRRRGRAGEEQGNARFLRGLTYGIIIMLAASAALAHLLGVF